MVAGREQWTAICAVPPHGLRKNGLRFLKDTQVIPVPGERPNSERGRKDRAPLFTTDKC